MDRISRLAPLGLQRLRVLDCLGGDSRFGACFEPAADADIYTAFATWVAHQSQRRAAGSDQTSISLLAAGRLLTGDLAAADVILDHLPAVALKLPRGPQYLIAAPLYALSFALPLPADLRDTQRWIAGSAEQATLRVWLAEHREELRWLEASGAYFLPTQLSSRLCVVMLPGLDGTGRLFRRLLDALPPQVDAVVVPFPEKARGGAGRLSRALDYIELSSHVQDFLPKDRPFAILGESFSGPLALDIASRNLRNLIGVVLVASFVTRAVAWLRGYARHAVRPFMFRLPIHRLLLRWFVLGENAPAELIDSAIDCATSVAPVLLARRIKAALSVDATQSFIRCPVPILYLGGTQDRLIDPETAQRLKALRPDLDCVMLDAPHFVLQRAPAAAAQAITAFVSRHHRLEAPAGRA